MGIEEKFECGVEAALKGLLDAAEKDGYGDIRGYMSFKKDGEDFTAFIHEGEWYTAGDFDG